jgi:hypothetical protein
MGHSISWDNEEKTVVFQCYDKDVTKKDLYAMVQESAAMLNTCEHKVHLIIDQRTVRYVMNAADMAFLEEHKPKNQGVVILIVEQNVETHKSITQKMGRRVAPHAFSDTYFVASLDEARKILQEHYGIHYPSIVTETQE